MKGIFDKLNINTKFTKEIKRPKYFTKVKDIVPHQENFNFMADLLIMPKTKEGFKYLLVVVDLGNDEFDIEPMKNKEAKTALDSLKKMFKRKYLKIPKYTLATDDGSEFKSVFQKYLYDNSIFHKVALPNRHSQMSNVESLNKQLGRLFIGYMNKMEEETGKSFNEWTDIIEIIRKDLNVYRKKKTINPYKQKFQVFDSIKEPKFKVGDIVYRQSDVPLNALGKQQPTKTFRTGDYRYDMIPKKITQILYFGGDVPYRYMLEGISRASYTENQLIKSDEKETKYKVKQIIGKRTRNKQIQYLVWWDKYLKKDATWETKAKLIEDGLLEYINKFEKS